MIIYPISSNFSKSIFSAMFSALQYSEAATGGVL